MLILRSLNSFHRKIQKIRKILNVSESKYGKDLTKDKQPDKKNMFLLPKAGAATALIYS